MLNANAKCSTYGKCEYQFMNIARIDITKYIKDDDLTIEQDRLMMVKELTEKLEKRYNTDIVLKNAKEMEYCHGEVLRHHSEVFDYYLPTGSVVNLSFDQVHPTIFPMLYKWMTSESIEVPREKLIDLLEAGHFLYMPKLVGNIFECMDDKRIFTAVDAIDTYFEAKAKNKLGIADLMMGNVRKYFLLMIDTEEYRDMDVSCLCNLLNSDELSVQSEIEVFYAVFVWIYVDLDVRKVHLKRILKTVRFKLLPAAFLCSIGMHLHELQPDVARILHRRMQKTMWFHQELSMGLAIDDKFIPRERIWIRDPACPYKDLIEKELHISHIDFMQYVVSLDDAEEFSARICEKLDANETSDKSEGGCETDRTDRTLTDEIEKSDETLEAASSVVDS